MCGNYSREETIQGQKLYEEIRYTKNAVKVQMIARTFFLPILLQRKMKSTLVIYKIMSISIFQAMPFIKDIRKWVASQRRQRSHRRDSHRRLSTQSTTPNPQRYLSLNLKHKDIKSSIFYRNHCQLLLKQRAGNLNNVRYFLIVFLGRWQQRYMVLRLTRTHRHHLADFPGH